MKPCGNKAMKQYNSQFNQFNKFNQFPSLTSPPTQMEKRLYLLDAFALIYRAFFGFGSRPLINSKGMNTAAAHGFTNVLYGLLSEEKATHLAVVFDPPGGTFRSEEFPFYKAHREAMPEDIRNALPYIKQIVDGFNVPRLEVLNYEADDVIGTIAKKAEQDGFKVYMVTPDKDFGQLVSENIFMYKPAHQKKPVEILGVPEILAKWDIDKVDQVIDVLGMMGDSADNIPGIRGIGQKTAAKLLKQFGSLENMLDNIDQIKGATRKKVEAGKKDGIISKKLATIILDVPVEYHPDSYKIDAPDKEALSSIFAELEFRTISKRILGDDFSVNQPIVTTGGQMDLFGGSPAASSPSSVAPSTSAGEEEATGRNLENTPHEYYLMDTPEKHEELLAMLLKEKLVCFDTETTGVDANIAELVGLSFCFKKNVGYYVPTPENQADTQAIIDTFQPFFKNENIAKVGHNIKYDLLILKWYHVEVKGILHDSMVAHYLFEPDMRHKMDILAENYLGYTPVPIEDLIGKKGKKQLTMRSVPIDKAAEYAAEDADITLQLHQEFQSTLAKHELTNLYQTVEMPLVKVLTEMEYNGVRLDVDFLKEYSKELDKDILTLRDDIYRQSGTEFNIDSPKQLGEVLFDTMKIPYSGKKTKTGQYSTNERTLSKLAETQPIVDTILSYRELRKLKSTYVDALPLLVNPKTERIHTTYSQTIAATGRLSSHDPNLQNIPIRTPRGREIRKAFIPRDDEHILLAADYSQVELRLMAHLSGDEAMIAAFKDGLDIHTATAARVYGVDLEDVDKEMRRKAKMVNFGIIYGITAFGLAQRLGIKRGEASDIIKEYFKQYPKVEAYMTTTVEKAKELGYAETILGRRRYLKDIHSANRTVRQFAERNAINSPIQGAAADMIKVAMINVHKAMQAQGLKSKMLLQVHDELVFDAHKSELEVLKTLVRDNMVNAMPVSVPIVVDMGTGANWLEAH